MVDESLIGAVAFIFINDAGEILLEACPKKRLIFGGTWFVPGGKIELGETPYEACERECREELGIEVRMAQVGPVVEAGRYLLRPFLIHSYSGVVPAATLDEMTPLRWFPIADALKSHVPQVRMLAAIAAR